MFVLSPTMPAPHSCRNLYLKKALFHVYITQDSLCSISHLVLHCIVRKELSGSAVGGHCCLHKEVCSPPTFAKCSLYINQLRCMTWIWLKTNSTYVFRIIPGYLTRCTTIQLCYPKLNADRLTLQRSLGRLLRQEHQETLQAGIASSLEPQCLIQHLNIHDSTHPIG